MLSDLSLGELERAWERVLENEGCAGADGVTLARFEREADGGLAALLAEVRGGSYRPLPLLKIVVEKKAGSHQMRRLLVPAVRDRVLQTAIARRLSHSFEEEFLESSFGYRPGRSVDRAVARVIQLRERGFVHVVDADITAFFDRVPHSHLLGALASQGLAADLLEYLRQTVDAQYWDGKRVRALERGIAQGSPLSPVLANFFLTPLDAALEASGNHLVRYADDFLVLCQTAEEAKRALAETSRVLTELGLTLNQMKTRLTSFDESFVFLGVFFYGNRAWIPWKTGKPQGRMLFMARPMPADLLARYQRPPQRTAMEEAFREAGATVVASAASNAESEAGQGGKGVAFLYLTEQGAVLRKSGDRFLVEKDDRLVKDLPYHKLEHVLVFGNVQVTTQAIGELLERGVELSFFSRQGRFRGSLTAPQGKNVFLRLAQFEVYKDGAKALEFARATVRAKVANGLAVLARYAERETALPGEYAGHKETMEQALASLPQAGELAALGGLEGTSARSYFTALMLFNKSAFEWPGRVKHPATDPLNALMSLAYTLLTSELMALAEAQGLDPFVGFLHQPDYGRPSLALDLVEAFRHPVADRLVLTLVNRAQFGPEDFVSGGDGKGLFLTPEGLKRFLAEYERWMLAAKAGTKSFRALLRQECEHLAAAVSGKAAWAPFDWSRHEGGREECNTSSVTI